MAFLGGLLGGGDGADPLDIYGDLFTDKQKAALRQKELSQGLFRMSEALAKAAQPSPYKPGIGTFGATLGSAASAFGGGGSEAMDKQLKAMQIAEQVRSAKQKREWTAKILPMLTQAAQMEQQYNLPPGTLTSQVPGAPGAPSPSGQTPTTSTTAPAGSDYTGPTNAELGAPPVSMGLTQAGMSAFGLPDATAAPSGGPPTPAERLKWNQTVGTGGPYTPLEDWVAKQRAGQQSPPLAPGGTGPSGLPARIGMRGTGPNAVMIDLDTGQPIQSAPGGPIAMPPPGAPPLKQTGLLPPPDQVVGQDGQPLTGSGLFPNMLASYTGGTPGGTLPFQLAASTPTGAGAPPGAAGGAPSRNDPRGVVPYIRERARALGIDPDVAERVARSEGVGTFQSSVIQKSGRREPSWGAFQLYTGGGMGNDFQRDTGLDPSDPANEKATIDYALKNAVNTGWTPWHGARGAGIGPRTGLPGGPSYAEGGQDTVIPSGHGIPASALRNVADTAPAGAAPAGGLIPGLNMTPQQAGAMGAITEILGLDNPFKPILDAYYKSPKYLEESSGATEKGKDPYVRGQAKYTSDLTLGREMITRGVVLNPDGSLGVRPGAEALSAAENAKFTGDIKEYNFYAQQAKERGDIPKPFTTWDIERKRAAATMINTAEGQEAAQYKGRIAVDQKIATDAAEKALAVRQMMPLLDEALQLARKTPEGLAGPVAARWGQVASAFGVPVSPGASNAELLQAINQRLIPMVREPGAQSNAEMDNYLRAGPGLMATADGRVKIAEMTKAIGQRSIEIARVYREHLGSPKLYDELAKLDKPLFTDEQRAAMQSATTQQGTTAPSSPQRTEQMRTEAMQAIANGAPKEKVLQRLREMGIDTGGL